MGTATSRGEGGAVMRDLLSKPGPLWAKLCIVAIFALLGGLLVWALIASALHGDWGVSVSILGTAGLVTLFLAAVDALER